MSERAACVSSGSEPDDVRARYARRDAADARYRLTQPAPLLAAQERQRALAALFRRHGLADLSAATLLEVGSGGGGNLLELLWMGFRPEHLCGIELLEARHEAARERLPAGVRLLQGDASTLDPEGFTPCDLVYASTVFSSLLDDAFQQRLAARLWSWVKPGGAVLWYDFAVGNPNNRDVRGVSVSRLRQLFPDAQIEIQRVTLAPPLARRTASWSLVHAALHAVPWLRTHRLAWVGKR